MLTRLRSTVLAWGSALVLALSATGLVAGASLVADSSGSTVDAGAQLPGTTDTTLTWEDIDGNGIDDDCQDPEAVADPDSVTAALAAADLDGDGTISVSEAARSGWTGGKNCNHGGYVSGVAGGDDEADDEEDAAEEAEADAAPETCEPEPEPLPGNVGVTEPAANAHGKAVSTVARSEAVGGKNCNHGGAVSEAAKKERPTKAERAAAKAERAAARDAAKAARNPGENGQTKGPKKP
jgi:hypothetical protein